MKFLSIYKIMEETLKTLNNVDPRDGILCQIKSTNMQGCYSCFFGKWTTIGIQKGPTVLCQFERQTANVRLQNCLLSSFCTTLAGLQLFGAIFLDALKVLFTSAKIFLLEHGFSYNEEKLKGTRVDVMTSEYLLMKKGAHFKLYIRIIIAMQ